MVEYQLSEVSTINTNQGDQRGTLSKHCLRVELLLLLSILFFYCL